MKHLIFLLLFSLLSGQTENWLTVENSYGCSSGAVGIADDSLRLDRDCDGTFDTVLVEDTSKTLPTNRASKYWYQWHIDTATVGTPDSATYKEVIMCASKVLGGWIYGVDLTSNTDQTVDSIVTVTYGSTGYGGYETYFSMCDSIKFITRVLAGSGTDTVIIQKRALKTY
jgi:hypothetical protein